MAIVVPVETGKDLRLKAEQGGPDVYVENKSSAEVVVALGAGSVTVQVKDKVIKEPPSFTATDEVDGNVIGTSCRGYDMIKIIKNPDESTREVVIYKSPLCGYIGQTVQERINYFFAVLINYSRPGQMPKYQPLHDAHSRAEYRVKEREEIKGILEGYLDQAADDTDVFNKFLENTGIRLQRKFGGTYFIDILGDEAYGKHSLQEALLRSVVTAGTEYHTDSSADTILVALANFINKVNK